MIIGNIGSIKFVSSLKLTATVNAGGGGGSNFNYTVPANHYADIGVLVTTATVPATPSGSATINIDGVAVQGVSQGGTGTNTLTSYTSIKVGAGVSITSTNAASGNSLTFSAVLGSLFSN